MLHPGFIQSTTSNRENVGGWHAADWGLQGWLETMFESAGIAAAAVGAATTVAAERIELSGVGYGVAGVALLLFLGAAVQLMLRVKQQELISLVFAALNLAGHASLVWVAMYAPAATWVPVAFGLAYVAGEFTKQRFLAVSGYADNGQTPAEMRRLSTCAARSSPSQDSCRSRRRRPRSWRRRWRIRRNTWPMRFRSRMWPGTRR